MSEEHIPSNRVKNSLMVSESLGLSKTFALIFLSGSIFIVAEVKILTTSLSKKFRKQSKRNGIKQMTNVMIWSVVKSYGIISR